MSGNGSAPTLVVLAAGLARRYGGLKPLAPVGPHGEAVLDLLASDAVKAGYGRIVLVVHPETGLAIRYHVERCWPASVPVSFAVQQLPLGTTHAVLAARSELDRQLPFAVANADDVYGEPAMRLLADHLHGTRDTHGLVAYQLRSTVLTGAPVTRGICEVAPDGTLTRVTERRQVTDGSARDGEGRTGPGRFTADDGGLPATLDGSSPVSVNLWGFRPEIWPVLDDAMSRSGLDEQALVQDTHAGARPSEPEVLLPEVVGAMVDKGSGLPVTVLHTDQQCIGVTHAGDLPIVRDRLGRQVARGERSERLWDGVRGGQLVRS